MTLPVVAPGVRRIEIPLPIPALKIVNVYLVEGERGWSLVDSGIHTEAAERALRDALAAQRLALRDVGSAFVTHLHPDHMGMAGTLEREGVAVAMHAPEIAAARYLWDRSHEAIDRVYEFFGRHGMPADVDQAMRDAWIRMTTVVDPFRLAGVDDGAVLDLGGRAGRVRWTPGHTDFHAVLVEERDAILFSGDHVLPRITSNVGLYPHSRDDPLGDFLRALEALRDLRVTRVLPAHGEPFDDLRGRVDELIAHHEARLDAVLAALGTRERSAYAIAVDLFPRVTNAMEMRFALAETLAHLRYLERRGRVLEVGDAQRVWTVVV